MKRAVLLLSFAALVLAVAYPAAAGAAQFRGIVIAKQAKRHALIVASSGGLVRTVRTTHLVRAGSRVAVRAARLADGTFRASQVSVRGHARRARVRAVVVRYRASRFLLSAGHSVFSVRSARAMSFGDANGIQPGAVVNATVSIGQNGELDDDQMQQVGEVNAVDLEGSIVSVTAPTATTPGQIVLKAHGQTLTITVPAGFTLPPLTPNQDVQLTVSLDTGNVLTLLKVDGERDEENGDNGDNHGGGGGGGGDGGGGDGGGGGGD